MTLLATPAPVASDATASHAARDEPLFRSYWMGGYEGADHLNSRAKPLDLNRSNGHWTNLEQDYARLADFGIRTVRESIGWRLSTGADGRPDLRMLHRIADAARRSDLQVIWTIHHYGLPSGLDFFSPDFTERFADFCGAIARALHGRCDTPTIFQPVNEISFLSWAAAASDLIHPYRDQPDRHGFGYDLKCQLVRAALAGCDALWSVEPGARIVHTDPLIHVVPAQPDDQAMCREADAVVQEQFQAWDMLCGRLEPSLGGAPRYLDVLGINYYHSNQWEHPSHDRLYWHLGDTRRRPLEDMLDEVWRRYRRPLFIAETGHVGDGRTLWLDEVAIAAQRCAARGVPLQGICLYPLVDRPDWEDGTKWHRSGLWDAHLPPPSPVAAAAPSVATETIGMTGRALHAPYARRLRQWQSLLPPSSGSLPPFFSSSILHPRIGHSMTPLIVFSHLRWDFVYQRPQQLLSRLAENHPVIFFEEPIGHAARPVLERLHPCDGVEVLRPHLPGDVYGFHDDHAPQLRALLAEHLRSQQVEDYWLWFYTPMALPIASDLQPAGVIYDCMDELSAFRNAPPQLIERETELLSRADLVFTGGRSLYEAKRSRHPQVHCFPSSVDAAHYARAARGEVDDSAQAHIPHPRLGYFGVIDERIDLSLIAALADANAQWQVVMVGPVVKIDPASLPQRANIHWLGQRAYADLPDLIAGWDVCLMPFAMNESTRYISPTKTLEYLAAGRAVVSTPIRDVVEPYGRIVGIADTHEAFIAACERLLQRSPQQRAIDDAAAAQVIAGTSWDHTAAAMAALIAAAHPALQDAGAIAGAPHPAIA